MSQRSILVLCVFLLALLCVSEAKPKKDWSKVSDKELDEEAGRFEPGDPDNPMEYDAQGHPMPPKKGKAEMAFVTIRPEYFVDKHETEQIGFTWSKVCFALRALLIFVVNFNQFKCFRTFSSYFVLLVFGIILF